MASANKGGKDKTVGGLHSAAVKLGHAGGVKGGPVRAASLSANRRSQIAKQGGEARAKKKS